MGRCLFIFYFFLQFECARGSRCAKRKGKRLFFLNLTMGAISKPIANHYILTWFWANLWRYTCLVLDTNIAMLRDPSIASIGRQKVCRRCRLLRLRGRLGCRLRRRSTRCRERTSNVFLLEDSECLHLPRLVFVPSRLTSAPCQSSANWFEQVLNIFFKFNRSVWEWMSSTLQVVYSSSRDWHEGDLN